MPITDEIIELEPVKKSKLKLIILITVASVMLALAVVFLVLYIIKPDAQVDPKAVKQVEIIDNPLFDSGVTDGGDKIYLASASNTYTLKALAAAEGGASDHINWEISHPGAVTEKSKDNIEEGERIVGTYTFTPNATFAASNPDTTVTITARDAYSGKVYTSIKLKIVAQQIESFDFGQFYYNLKNSSSSPTRRNITNKEISVPVSEKIRTVTFTFTPHGALNENTGEYSPISYINGSSNIKAESNKAGVVTVQNGGVVQTSSDRAEGSVTFTVLGTGDADITLTDVDSGKTEVLKVRARTCSELGIIEEIYIYDEPVTADFYEEHKNDTNSRIPKPEANSKLVLPYGNNIYGYNDILNHVVILPLSIQYDSDKHEMKTDWYNAINVTVKSNAIRIENTNGRTPVIRTSGVASEKDCGITVSDRSTSGLGASGSLGINVVAGNAMINSAVTVGAKEYSNKDIDDNAETGIPVSKGDVFTYKVTYELTAPKETECDDLAELSLMSTGYSLDIPGGFSVKLGDKAIESGKAYSFTKDELTVTHPVESSNRFYAEATFTISVQTGSGGKYALKFNKIASPYGGTYDAQITKEVNFAVTVNPTRVGFIEDDEILRIITENGNKRYVGRFEITKQPVKTGDVWQGALSVYIQHLEPGEELWFDAESFIYKDGDPGASKISSDITNLISNSEVFRKESTSGKIVFKSTTTSGSAGYVTVLVKNNSNNTIGDFTVHFYMLDAIAGIECENTSEENKSYNADAETNEHYGKLKLANRIKYTNVFDKSKKDYTKISDVHISYMGTGAEVAFAGSWNEAKTEKTFTLVGETEPLFKYVKASGEILVLDDLFACGYNAGKDISRIKVTYVMDPANNADDHCYVGGPKECSKVYNFIRQIDGVKVFTDREYKTALTESNGTVSLDASHGRKYDLYLSSVVTVDKGKAGEHDVIIATEQPSRIAQYNRAYFSLPTDSAHRNALSNVAALTVDGEIDGNNFYDFGFTANLATQGTLDVTVGIAAVSNKRLIIKIQNLSREIEYIKFSSVTERNAGETDAAFLERLVSSGSVITGISLGKYKTLDGFATDDYYKKEFSVVVKYNPYSVGDQEYTSAKLNIPAYFDVYVNGNQYNSDNGIIELRYDGSIDAELAYVSAKIKVQLNRAKVVALKNSSLNGAITAASNTAPDTNCTLTVDIGTGVDEIMYRIYNGNNTPIEGVDWNNGNNASVTIDVSSLSNIEQFGKKLRIRYKSYAVTDEYAVWTDTLNSDDKVNDPDGNGFFVNGITLDKDNVDVKIMQKVGEGYADYNETTDDSPIKLTINRKTRMIEIEPRAGKLTAGTYNYKFICTDRSGGDASAVTHELLFSVTVNVTATVAVNFDGNGGTVSEASRNVVYGTTLGALPVAPTRDGHTFNGWFTAASGGDAVTGNETIIAPVTYYAHWTINEYTVTFDPNGGDALSEDDGTRTVNHGFAVGALPAAPTLTGYVFAGWFDTDAQSGGTQVTASTVITHDVTFYARWIKNAVTVIFDGNGGTVSSSSETVEYGTKVSDVISGITNPARTGYDFVKWQIKVGDIASDIGANDVVTENTTLIAVWQIKTYTVTFDVNDGNALDTADRSRAVSHGNEIGSLPIPTRANHGFVGWFTAENGGTQITASDTVTGEVTYYAHWEIYKYTVTFDVNGGDALSDSDRTRTVEHGSVVGTLPTPTRTGYKFDGWKTEGGTSVDAGTKVNADVTYVAQWTINKYIVSFDANGGVVDIASKTYDHGASYTGLPTPTRFGYKFDYWTMTKDGTDELSDSDKVSGNITVYAKWTERETTVTFISNGGSSCVPVTYKQAYGDLPTPTQAGHSFNGWWTAYTGGTEIKSGVELLAASAQELIALWTELSKVEVTIDANGGSIDSSIKTSCEIYVGETYGTGSWLNSGDTGLITTVTRGGYSFVGWFTEKDGGTQIIDTTVVTATTSHTIYAHWTPNAIIVTYDYDGGTGSKAFDTVNAGQTENLPELPKPTKYGYIFDGWYKVTSTGTTETERTTSLSGITTATTLKAKWIAKSNINVSFNVNYTGGTNPAAATVTFGDEYVLYMPANPTRSGYDFAGWYTAANGGNLIVTSGDDKTLVNNESGHTLYAHWTAKRFDVTFDAGSGTFASGTTLDVSNTYGTKYALPETNPTRQGYTFGGWLTATSGGSEVTANTDVTEEAAHTLYAHWDKVQYTITLNAMGGNVGATAIVTDIDREFKFADLLPTSGNKTGYHMTGTGDTLEWFTDSDCTHKVVAGTTATGNMTVYAKWEANKYYVNLYANGGYFGSNRNDTTRSNIEVTYDGTYAAIYASQYTPTYRSSWYGYEFAGWFTSDSGGERLSADSIVKITETTKLYAHWSTNATAAYMLNFAVNTSGSYTIVSGSIASKSLTSGDMYGELPVLSLTGYTFDGWFTKDGSVGNDWGTQASATSVISGDVTLYAKWTANTYVIVLNNEGVITTVDVVYDTDYSDYVDADGNCYFAPTKVGYTLKWKNGSAEFAVDGKVKITSTTVLTAEWTAKNNITLNFDLNYTGAPSVEAKTVTFDTAYSGYLPVDPTRTGYKFDGWYTAKNGGNLIVTSGDNATLVNNASEHTLYAYWTPKTVTVTFNANGGTFGSESNTTVNVNNVYDSAYTLPENAPTREGFTFAGWYTAADGDNIIVTDGDNKTLVNNASNHTLYAHWNEVTE